MENLVYQVAKRQKVELLQSLNADLSPREQLNSVRQSMSSPLVKVIYGPRRCGKSTLARLAIKDLKFAYFNFEDDALPNNLTGDMVIKALQRLYGSFDVLFFDEIQNLSRWEPFLHRLHREGANCLITGSNAHLLSGELATALTGRHLAFELLPFSYAEFLSLKTHDHGHGHDDLFMRYLIHGGFPEVILQRAEPNAYLATLWDSIVLKDIVRRHKVRTIQELSDLYTLVIHAATARFNNDSLVRSLDAALSAPTVKKFLRFGREAYLFTELECFHFGARKRIKSDRKVYVFDNGFIAAKKVNITSDRGRLLENLVFVELVRRGYKINSDLFYYTTNRGYEVDFLLRQAGRNHELVQVCWTLQEQKTRQRELRSLVQAAETLAVKNLTILTFDHTETIQTDGLTINVMAVADWLLAPSRIEIKLRIS